MIKKTKLIERTKNGFLVKVINPNGKKPNIDIYQGIKRGFSAEYAISKRQIKGSSMNAEAFARRLARKGHKIVTIRD